MGQGLIYPMGTNAEPLMSTRMNTKGLMTRLKKDAGPVSGLSIAQPAQPVKLPEPAEPKLISKKTGVWVWTCNWKLGKKKCNRGPGKKPMRLGFGKPLRSEAVIRRLIEGHWQVHVREAQQ